MPGRPDFSQPGTQGSGQTVATSQPKVIRKLNAGFSASLASGSTETAELYAPVGAQYEVLTGKLIFNSDADATTGDHAMRLVTWGNERVLEGDAAYNGSIKYWKSGWQNYRDAWPSDPVAAQRAAKLAFGNENNPIEVQHINNLDVTYDATRYANLFVKETEY